jgi:hypothetical protein
MPSTMKHTRAKKIGATKHTRTTDATEAVSSHRSHVLNILTTEIDEAQGTSKAMRLHVSKTRKAITNTLDAHDSAPKSPSTPTNLLPANVLYLRARSARIYFEHCHLVDLEAKVDFTQLVRALEMEPDSPFFQAEMETAKKWIKELNDYAMWCNSPFGNDSVSIAEWSLKGKPSSRGMQLRSLCAMSRW